MEPGGFCPTYGVELLYRERPRLRKDDLLRSLAKRCPGVAPLDGETASNLLAFVHTDHPIELSDATIAAQTFIAPADKPLLIETLEPALQQSWRFPEARRVVQQCTSSALVSDVMSSSLPYAERLDLFTRALSAVLEVAPPEAIHWVPTQQIVSPLAYLRASRESADAQFSAGPVNVRFFNISNSDGEMLMDTLGLAALGLPDLQCHFKKFQPGGVAGMLYSLASYIFEQGDVIEDGHTVEGAEPGTKWRAQHEVALIAPERQVLDVDPGEPFAAGGRTRRRA